MPGKRVTLRGTQANFKRLYLSGAVVLVLGAGILLYLVIHTQTFIKATSHQPETYTELYFSNPNQLPSVARSGSSVPVHFTVHNVEARAMTYTYDVEYTSPAGQTEILSQQQFSLSNGATRAIASEAQLPAGGGRAEISVVLVNRPEAIHYWVEAVS